ncbi:hypothetical protein L7F22_067257 [Adiantum nelumboides]|nr:hypothetical protein [Adiantum nelumboides]
MNRVRTDLEDKVETFTHALVNEALVSHLENLENQDDDEQEEDEDKEDHACTSGYPEDHKGERRKSCSSMKKIRILQKACERLGDAYEDEFKMESSDDDDDDERVYMLPLSHEMGIPKMEEKEVKFHIIMSDVVDDKKDHNFYSEHVEKHIGMSKVEYEEGEHSITKNGLKIATPLKIAMSVDQDAPLSVDVPREQGQNATLKKAPKVPKEAKQDMIVLEGSSPLKVQKSGHAKKLSGTAGSEPPKTQVNKRKAKADVKEKEGTAVLEQQNVKRLKRMKEVEVREAIEQKIAVDELEKVLEVKIALKGVKNKAKKHVEKGQEDEGLADKAHALVGSSKRPKLQVKRAKQSGASYTTSTTMRRIKVGTIVLSDEDKNSGGSNRGSDDDGYEDDESNQDGSGDDDPNYGSDGDADAADGGSDKSDGGDDISGGSDGEDDGSGGGGSGSGSKWR